MTQEIREEEGKKNIYTYDETIYSSLDDAINDYTDGIDGKGYSMKEFYVDPAPVNLSAIDLTTLTIEQLKQLKEALNSI